MLLYLLFCSLRIEIEVFFVVVCVYSGLREIEYEYFDLSGKIYRHWSWHCISNITAKKWASFLLHWSVKYLCSDSIEIYLKSANEILLSSNKFILCKLIELKTFFLQIIIRCIHGTHSHANEWNNKKKYG